MNSFQPSAQPAKQVAGNNEKRKQRSMQSFKRILQNLVSLFRKAAQVETVYLYWVNRARRQFVLETKATILQSVVFQDRVSFENHFLNDFKTLTNPVNLTLGEDIKQEDLAHYQDSLPVENLTLLPFVKTGKRLPSLLLNRQNRLRNRNKRKPVKNLAGRSEIRLIHSLK